MDPIEKAIRNAFEKGNADDRAFREKVYRSAFAALDRALQANPSITVEVAIKRRKAMQARITEIESEFLPAVLVATPEPNGGQQAPSVEAPSIEVRPPSSTASVAPAVRREPSLDDDGRTPLAAVVPEPVLPGSALRGAEAANGGIEVSPDLDERRSRRRRMPLTSVFLGLIVLAAVGFGLWWAVQNGLIKPPAQSNNAPPTIGSVDVTPPVGAPSIAGQDDQRAWIAVFTPSDPTLVSAPADAMAEVMKDDTGSFLRIRSGASGSAVRFDVGQGVLASLAGKHAVFDILARTEEGKETQMSVGCNFGDLGDCGRKRYAVGHERNEYLFDVQFPDKRSNAAGTIAVNSDFDGQGKSVDIYEIRVSIAE